MKRIVVLLVVPEEASPFPGFLSGAPLKLPGAFPSVDLGAIPFPGFLSGAPSDLPPQTPSRGPTGGIFSRRPRRGKIAAEEGAPRRNVPQPPERPHRLPSRLRCLPTLLMPHSRCVAPRTSAHLATRIIHRTDSRPTAEFAFRPRTARLLPAATAGFQRATPRLIPVLSREPVRERISKTRIPYTIQPVDIARFRVRVSSTRCPMPPVDSRTRS